MDRTIELNRLILSNGQPADVSFYDRKEALMEQILSELHLLVQAVERITEAVTSQGVRHGY